MTSFTRQSVNFSQNEYLCSRGKEADISVWSGDPIDPRRHCQKTFVGGKLVYDAAKKRRF